MTRIARAFCALIVLGFLGGCATTRSYTTLTVPAPSSAISTTTKIVVIDEVQDHRQFQVDPRDPSVPSLKSGEQYQLSADQRKAAIGRKRNTYGMALGDYQLNSGQTVETITRDLVAKTLQSLGYQVPAQTDAAPPDAEHVRVAIDQFWAWVTPGFWTATIEAEMKTQLTFAGPGGDKSIDVRGYGRNQVQTGREANWQLAYDRAFRDYEKNLQQAIGNSGL